MWIEKRKATQATKTKVNNVGIYSGSLIVQFFLKGKRKFSELNWKP